MKLISPVFAKEMTQFASSRRNFIVKCLFLACVSITVVWIGIEGSTGFMGMALCTSASVIAVVTVMFAVPIMTARIVAGEVEANTLHLLFLTNLTSWNIAHDKALSRLAQISYLIVLLLPIYACGMLFGGISWLQILGTCGYLLGIILLCAGCGIFCGTMSRSFSSALLLSYMSAPAIMAIVAMILGYQGAGAQGVFMRSNPIAVVALFQPGIGESALWEWRWFLTLGACVYVIGTAFATWRTHRLKGLGGNLVSTRSKRSPRRVLRKLYASIFCSPQSGTNPIAWRDGQVAPAPFMWVARRMLLFVMICVPAVTWYFKAYRSKYGFMAEVFAGSMLGFAAFFGSVSILIYGATSIAREKTAGTFPVLLATAMSGADLSKGYLQNGLKLVFEVTVVELICIASMMAATEDLEGFFIAANVILGLLVAAIAILVVVRNFFPDVSLHHVAQKGYWALAVALTFVSFLFAYGGEDSPNIVGAFTLGLMNYFLLISALWISAKRETVRAAIGWAFALVFAVHVIPAIVGGIFSAEIFLGLAPATLVGCGHALVDDPSGDLVAAVIVGIIAYGLGAVCLTASLTSNFDRFSGRSD